MESKGFPERFEKEDKFGTFCEDEDKLPLVTRMMDNLIRIKK